MPALFTDRSSERRTKRTTSSWLTALARNLCAPEKHCVFVHGQARRFDITTQGSPGIERTAIRSKDIPLDRALNGHGSGPDVANDTRVLAHSESAGGLNEGDGRRRWPYADVIIGNPPFLGAKRLKPERGVEYVNALRRLYPDVPAMAEGRVMVRLSVWIQT